MVRNSFPSNRPSGRFCFARLLFFTAPAQMKKTQPTVFRTEYQFRPEEEKACRERGGCPTDSGLRGFSQRHGRSRPAPRFVRSRGNRQASSRARGSRLCRQEKEARTMNRAAAHRRSEKSEKTNPGIMRPSPIPHAPWPLFCRRGTVLRTGR